MPPRFRARLTEAGRPPRTAKRLHFVLGDQLDTKAAVIRNLERETDVVLMTEVKQEAEHVPSHRQRTTLFLSAMRHFALGLAEDGFRVRYVTLDDRSNTHAFDTELERAVTALSPEAVSVIEPGEHRVQEMLHDVCARADVPLDVVPDDSFTCSLDEFEAWAEGRANLVMEYFYRQRRRELDILVTDGKPEGGAWNYDKDNRQAFRRTPAVPPAYQARADDITCEVMRLVEKTFPSAYGRMEHFRWPVERGQARRSLAKFIDERLASFGTYEDAMWAGEPVLYHSALSSSINLKLLSPMECVEAAVAAYEEGAATLNNVEGFVRQIIGWREFMRGIYYREGEDYAYRNALEHEGKLPAFFWNAETEMNCLRCCIGEVVENAYGHHIARLMVIGNFTLIAGVDPRAVHEWFLGMYVDGVEWATAPNVVGMSQHADGGIVATKPYAGSGKYIKRMSNYCDGCRYDVNARTGPDACPFNTFYWDFLIRHRKRFADNRRMALVLKNVDKMDGAEKKKVRERATELRKEFAIE